MLHANAFAGVPVRPAGQIARRVHAWQVRLQELIHRDALVDGHTRCAQPVRDRPHANARDDDIRWNGGAARQRHRPFSNRRDALAKVEHHAVRLRAGGG